MPENFVRKHGEAQNLYLHRRKNGKCDIHGIDFPKDSVGGMRQHPRSVLNDILGEEFMNACDAIASELYAEASE